MFKVLTATSYVAIFDSSNKTKIWKLDDFQKLAVFVFIVVCNTLAVLKLSFSLISTKKKPVV